MLQDEVKHLSLDYTKKRPFSSILLSQRVFGIGSFYKNLLSARVRKLLFSIALNRWGLWISKKGTEKLLFSYFLCFISLQACFSFIFSLFIKWSCFIYSVMLSSFLIKVNKFAHRCSKKWYQNITMKTVNGNEKPWKFRTSERQLL